jgi:hypothetical protein
MTRPDHDGSRYGGQGEVLGGAASAPRPRQPSAAEAVDADTGELKQVPAPSDHPLGVYPAVLPPGGVRAAFGDVTAPSGNAAGGAAQAPPVRVESTLQQRANLAPPPTSQSAFEQHGKAGQTSAGGTISRPVGAGTGTGTTWAADVAAPAGLSSGLAAAAAADVTTRLPVIWPDEPRTGTVYGTPRREETPPPKTPARRLGRLRIGWHSAPRRTLPSIGVSSQGTGLILGADIEQQPMPVLFFRPEPTRVTLVGGLWAAQLVVFRALALGAHVTVHADDDTVWRDFGRRAVDDPDRVTVTTDEVVPPGSAQRPELVLYDLGTAGPSTPPELGPWQTRMTVLRQLEDRGVPAVQEGHLVMMQRLDVAEAELAVTALRIGGERADLLQQMEDGMLALVGGGADRYLWVRPTHVEQQFAGPPRR